MINNEDQFEESKCELCGKVKSPDHTHEFDSPAQQKKYARITATRPVNPDVPTANPLDYARERMVEQTADPAEATRALGRVAQTEATSQKTGYDPRTGGSTLASGLRELRGGTFNGGMSTSASAHVSGLGASLKSHPAYAAFHKVHVTLKDHGQVATASVIGGGEQNSRIIPRALGRFHIGAVEPGSQDGVSGIRVNGAFYPDDRVHSVDYVKDAGAPKKTTANGQEDMSLDEQREWYDKSEQSVKDRLAYESAATQKLEARKTSPDFGRNDGASRASQREKEKAALVGKLGEEKAAEAEEKASHINRIYEAAKHHGISIPQPDVNSSSLETRAQQAGLTDEHLAAYDSLVQTRKSSGYTGYIPTQPKTLWYPTDSKG
ncbi:hypothetical protein UFOVP621_113 [uncultured Caudovirales phage]|uniref:Uncharacterized protein n=1 Tax=uncultured Caudovirales phage TaxID=2100421 RepID=A0A6J5N4N3_9CAUD|nr:hypothetical protein UFOVP621_113 [uncultured Caudovirales phage]